MSFGDQDHPLVTVGHKLDASYVDCTISHGTLRSDDLFSAFVDVLGEVDGDGAAKFKRDYAVAADDHTQDEIVTELTDALCEIAPEGTQFGAHEGDRSDFGFWRTEEL